VTIGYGLFIDAVISFLIVAFAVFLLFRSINKLQAEEPEKEPTTKDCPYCVGAVALTATERPHCTSELSGI
tara:strand:- start:361 stop:573 length:213 start_codon:yes stop_codon:yes gene_type:complete